MLRFGSRVGFKPPYFYNRPLRNRLHRITAPALVIWGEDDRMVPLSHGETYAKSMPQAQPLKVIPDAGHSVHAEEPELMADIISDFLAN
jgi:pimeloyl-ACP methyl ester carboxylesterase